MKDLFKQSNGRLKTSRIAAVIFLALLVCSSIIYKTAKSADKTMVRVEHLFEAKKAVPPVTVVKKPMPEPAENPNSARPENSKLGRVREKHPVKAQIKDPVPVNEPEQNHSSAADESKTQSQPSGQAPVKKPANPKREPGNTDPGQIAHTAENMEIQKENVQVPEKQENKIGASEKLTPEPDKKIVRNPKEKTKQISLPADEYFEVYKQWQDQGKTLARENQRVGLKIHNLENVYDLFQMKVVAVRQGIPHTDLEDFSRVAGTSLSEFSSTCFIVSQPWKKWGPSLKKAGFFPGGNIEVRYYTYDVVRNAIYARAVAAFEWGLSQKGLPADTEPATAEVIGEVYAVHKTGGGSFGVFVPRCVDFKEKGSIDIDLRSCFGDQKDISLIIN